MAGAGGEDGGGKNEGDQAHVISFGQCDEKRDNNGICSVLD
jgi:hypothetical protein